VPRRETVGEQAGGVQWIHAGAARLLPPGGRMHAFMAGGRAAGSVIIMQQACKTL
jgi:hypothetical protein